MATSERRESAALKTGDHLCCIYKTEEEQHAVLIPFLRQGLERGEKVLYITDTHAAQEALDRLQEEGLDLEVEHYLESGQLALYTADQGAPYLRDGVFEPTRMIELLQAETEGALAGGYSALNIAAEMAWVLRGQPAAGRRTEGLLIEYEARLNESFPGSQCLALCLYDRRRFEPSVLLEVLRIHPLVMVGAEHYENFYYVPPKELLSEDRQEAELRHWLEHLTHYHRAQEERIRAERLAAINQITVTVRHEINNPLTAVLGYAQWLYAQEEALPPDVREVLKQIEIAAIRIRDVLRKLDQVKDRPIPYLGNTMMIDIHDEDDDH